MQMLCSHGLEASLRRCFQVIKRIVNTASFIARSPKIHRFPCLLVTPGHKLAHGTAALARTRGLVTLNDTSRNGEFVAHLTSTVVMYLSTPFIPHRLTQDEMSEKLGVRYLVVWQCVPCLRYLTGR